MPTNKNTYFLLFCALVQDALMDKSIWGKGYLVCYFPQSSIWKYHQVFYWNKVGSIIYLPLFPPPSPKLLKLAVIYRGHKARTIKVNCKMNIFRQRGIIQKMRQAVGVFYCWKTHLMSGSVCWSPFLNVGWIAIGKGSLSSVCSVKGALPNPHLRKQPV